MRKLLIILLAAFLVACVDVPIQPVAFQVYTGNELLPPPYQVTRIIRGTIEPDHIAVTYTLTDEHGKQERPLTISGAEFTKFATMIRTTKITPTQAGNRHLGGTSFDITLIDAAGQTIMGQASNQVDWEQFVNDVGRMAGFATTDE